MTDLLTVEQRQLVDAVSAIDQEQGKQMELRFLMEKAGLPAHASAPAPAPAEADREKDDRQAQYARDAEEAGRAELERRQALLDEVEPMVRKIIDLTLADRHKEAFEFAWQSSGRSPGEFIQQELRRLAAGWRQDMLEARGQGGATTRKAQPIE